MVRRGWMLLAPLALTFVAPRLPREAPKLPRQAVQAEAPVDFYELLGVDGDATVKDIKAAYRATAHTALSSSSEDKLLA